MNIYTLKCSIDLANRSLPNPTSLAISETFSAFSTKVLDRMNQKHNRSSSPFTNLAEQEGHKVVTIGAGQPNY